MIKCCIKLVGIFGIRLMFMINVVLIVNRIV